MSAIETFLNHHSYKFPKGYPDFNNDGDIELLGKLLENYIPKFSVPQILLEATLGEEAKEAINMLKNSFPEITDDSFKPLSSRRFKIFVPGSERKDWIEKIDNLEGFKYDSSISGSSLGGFRYKDDVILLIKPVGLQGKAAHGIGNEITLVDEIIKYKEQGAKHISFIGPYKSIDIKNFTNVVNTGLQSSGGSKSDVDISDEQGNIWPLSLKMDNAGFWESSDRRYKHIKLKLLEKIQNGDFGYKLTLKPFLDAMGNVKKGVYKMYNEEEDFQWSGVIVTDLPDKEEESIIFGTDNAKVIYRTFSSNDFDLKGDTLYIKASKILEDMGDVEKHNLEPVLKIRHDSTYSKEGGLRALVKPYNKVYKDDKLLGNVMEVSYKDIIN